MPVYDIIPLDDINIPVRYLRNKEIITLIITYHVYSVIWKVIWILLNFCSLLDIILI